ncbi:MAG: hypothetical protein CMJ83_20010 [Planctomycetes bacterium]|nr:hypothetical protein [Planctomycetota bacterium]
MSPLRPVLALAALVLTVAPGLSPAQHGPPAVGREIPHHRATRQADLRAGRFPIKTASKDAQGFFDQGVAQLHAGDPYEAWRSFRQVALLDPECPMALWGQALASEADLGQAVLFAREAFKLREKAGPRGQQYIKAYARFFGALSEPKTEVIDAETGRRRAVAEPRTVAHYERLERDLDAIATDSKDVEAFAFRLRARAAGAHGAMTTEAHESMRARMHDDFALLRRILSMAADHPAQRYGVIVSGSYPRGRQLARDAWPCGPNVPGVGRMWQADARFQVRLGRFRDSVWAREAALRADHRQLARVGVHPYELDELEYNLEQLVRELRDLGRLREARSFATYLNELPRHPRTLGDDPARRPRLLLDTLALAEEWNEIVSLASGSLLMGGDRAIRAERAFAAGRACVMTGRLDAARKQFAVLTELTPAIPSAPGPRIGHLRDLIAHAEGDGAALARLARAGYSREHLAALCVESKDHTTAQSLVVTTMATTGPWLAARAWIEWSLGRGKPAEATFLRLRAVSTGLDLDAPLFRRLAPIARALKLPEDWRKTLRSGPPKINLDALGPARWSPKPSPPLRLPRGTGAQVDLKDLRGQPVLVVFFLGFGCVHCVEQLQDIQQHRRAFRDAGIKILAVGIDTVAEVKAARQAAEEADSPPMPFPILCDPGRAAFKEWGAFSDFTQEPLHGTYLIDRKGRLRWQDVSIEPFMATKFLLAEFQRLLATGKK